MNVSWYEKKFCIEVMKIEWWKFKKIFFSSSIPSFLVVWLVSSFLKLHFSKLWFELLAEIRRKAWIEVGLGGLIASLLGVMLWHCKSSICKSHNANKRPCYYRETTKTSPANDPPRLGTTHCHRFSSLIIYFPIFPFLYFFRYETLRREISPFAFLLSLSEYYCLLWAL